jgi:dTMP kinase
MTSAQRGRWVCIDGTEGAGKTTVTQALLEHFPNAVAINEFSRAPFGAALRSAVRESPHYISSSPVGQSLVFLGDFVELYESEIAPTLDQGATVLTDRGWISKYMYQRKVLERTLTPMEADELVRHILRLLPRPDFSVLLHAPLDVIRQRLIEREDSCDDARIAFISDAARLGQEFASTLPTSVWTAVDTNAPLPEVVATVQTQIAAAVPADSSERLRPLPQGTDDRSPRDPR